MFHKISNSLAILVLLAGTAWASGKEQPCAKYQEKICALCGKDSGTCKVVQKKFEACQKAKTCQAEICEQSLKQMKSVPEDMQKSMLCAEK